MKTQLSLIFVMSLISLSTYARNQLVSGGGVISGEPAELVIVRKCDGVSIDPTFSDTATIELAYEQALDSYTVIVTKNSNQKRYFPAVLSVNNLGETYTLYPYHDTPNQKKLGVVEFGSNNRVVSHDVSVEDYELTNCVSFASTEW